MITPDVGDHKEYHKINTQKWNRGGIMISNIKGAITKISIKSFHMEMQKAHGNKSTGVKT